MRLADQSGIVEAINGNATETSPAVAKMEDLLVEDGSVTLTIRLIMQGKVSLSTTMLWLLLVCGPATEENERDKDRDDVLNGIAYYCYYVVHGHSYGPFVAVGYYSCERMLMGVSCGGRI